MYLAAKYAGIEKPCTFDSGSHVTFAMKLVELNLFVWLLITLGITKLATRRFDCFSDPGTIGPQWKRWLTSFELYANGKGLIISEGTTAATKQR